MRYWGHHVFDIVYESPDKDGFSTSGWSRDYTGKWMVPRHEMIGIVFIGNVKCVRIVGFQNIIRFFFITLWVWLLLLLLWGKRVCWYYIAMYFVTVCPLSSSNKKWQGTDQIFKRSTIPSSSQKLKTLLL
jgi:hypothetical protein